tara:strand:- start:551 stop:811 length:261 start_codon:yes stop_codon:yes gene_type:complete
MDKTKKSNRTLKEHLAKFAEVAECINNLKVETTGIDIVVTIHPQLHSEIQEEISHISRLEIEKSESFSVNISDINFTFVKENKKTD